MRLGFNAYARPAPVPKMPEGLVELMEGLSREVLKHNPAETEVYAFCANHMKKLLDIRDAVEGKKVKKLSLEEKIAGVQENLRQDAVQRRKRKAPLYIEPGPHDEETTSHQVEEPAVEELTGAIEQTCEDLSGITKPEVEEVTGDIEQTCEGLSEITKPQVEEQTGAIEQTCENLSKITKPQVEEQTGAIEQTCEDLSEITKPQVEEQTGAIEQTCEDLSEITKPQVEEQTGAIEQTCEDLSEITKPQVEEQTGAIEQTCEVLSEITKPEVEELTGAIEQTCEDLSEITKPEVEELTGAIEKTCKDLSEITKLVTPSVPKNNVSLDKGDDIKDVAGNETKEVSVEEVQVLTDARGEVTGNDNVADIDTSAETNDPNEPAEHLSSEKIFANLMQSDTVVEAENQGQEVIKIKDDKVEKDITNDKIGNNDMNIETQGQEQEENTLIGENYESRNVGSGPVINIIDAEDKNSEENMEIQINGKDPEMNTESTSEETGLLKVTEGDVQDKNQEEQNILVPESHTSANTEMTLKEDEIADATNESSTNKSILFDGDKSDAINTETGPEVIEIVTQKTVQNLSAPVDTLKSLVEDIIGIETKTKEIITQENKTSEEQEPPMIENREWEENNVQDAMIENKDFEETGDSITAVSNDEINKEIEMIQLSKTPEIIDELSLKGTEISIVAKASDQENSVAVTSDEFNGTDNLNTSQVEKDLNSDRAKGKIEIGINKIAKSDSTHDVINEETTNESASETTTTEDPDETSAKNSGMDLETAAVTIQKVFRNFLFKSRQSTLDDVSNEEGSIDVSDDILAHEAVNMLKTEDELLSTNIRERRTLGITRMESVLQTVNEEKSLSLSTDDSSLSSAATIIQAHVRGFLVRNKLHNKTSSTNSQSLEAEIEPNKNKTVLNIHIVPEGGHFMSRDESMAMSLDLPYDGSPPTSSLYKLSLHPLSYDVSERRKLLKREDAIQSVSPPSNNSGKLSEDVDSVKDMTIHENGNTKQSTGNEDANEIESQVSKDEILDNKEKDTASGDTTPTKSVTGETVVEVLRDAEEIPQTPKALERNRTLTKQSSDEMDVVTPFAASEEKSVSPEHSENSSKLLHSSEFHEPVLPTNVSRSDTSVARGE